MQDSLRVISWANMLPWVLLGLCTTPKDGLWASSAEMVYGQTLRVPGDLFPDSTIPWSAVSQRADFEDKAGILLLSPPPGTGCLALMLSLIYRRQTMSLCGMMHIGGRCGGRMMALLVFWSRGRRIFLLTLGPGQGVSMHHLKPAHLDLDRPVELALPLGGAVLPPGLAAWVKCSRVLLSLWIWLRLGLRLGRLISASLYACLSVVDLWFLLLLFCFLFFCFSLVNSGGVCVVVACHIIHLLVWLHCHFGVVT